MKFPTEQACIDHLEALRWGGHVVSPFDPTSKVYKCKGNRYRCKNTKKYFNVRTGTIFDDTKLPLQKWFMALYLLSGHKKGISSHQLAKDLDVTQKTAWFLSHRIRQAFNHPVFKAKLGNTVEADEVYIGGKATNRHAKIPDPPKASIVGIIERSGHVRALHVPDTKGDTVRSVVESTVRIGSKLMTDEYSGYDRLRYAYVRKVVNHTSKQYVNGDAHTNTIEGFWSLLKRGLDGIYHSVSVKHLQKYVTEFALRYNTRQFPESGRFNLILTNIAGTLSYKELTGYDQKKGNRR